MQDSIRGLIFFILLVIPAVPVFSQTYGCGTPAETDFDLVQLSTGFSETVQMDVASDGRVFFIEKVSGRVMIYKPTTNTTVQAAQISVYATNSTASSPGNRADGLLGIALDPAFASNNFIYLYYSVSGSAPINRIARYTMSGDVLNTGSVRILLDITTHRDYCCHSAGGLMFDPDGNLYVSTGDNSTVTTMIVNPGAEGTSGNSNDLRGKILRIHPEANGTATIPAGNLFPPGTARTRPEIYAMGLRNPLRFAIDPRSRWLLVGDVGPDAANTEFDELNLIKTPGNFGWPYLNGSTAYLVNGTPANPNNLVNTSTLNTGLQQLPPAQSPALFYAYTGTTRFAGFNRGGGRVTEVGPLYYYNPSLSSQIKFPPFFDGKWFISDFRQRWIKALTLDAQGNITAAPDYFVNTVFNSAGFTRLVDMKFGPDGALYLLEYGNMTDYTPSSDGALFRLEYLPPNANCLPSTPVPISSDPRFNRRQSPKARMPLALLPFHVNGHDASGRRVRNGRNP